MCLALLVVIKGPPIISDMSGLIWMGIFYLCIFLIGSFFAKKRGRTEHTEDVLLAGRSLPLGVAIFTMSATWIGGGYINGTAEVTYSSGLVWAQAPWGYALSLVVGGLFFAKKMRNLNFKTMLDPIQQRFGKKVTTLFFLPALMGEIFWTAAILSALGATFGILLGLDFEWSIILSALIAISYTALGGLWAVAMTDVVQLILLFVGLFLALPFVLEQAGGWTTAWHQYKEHFGPSASFIPSTEALGGDYFVWWDYTFLLVFGGVAWQVYFQRVLSSKTAQIAQRLSYMAGIICLIAAIPPVILGVVGFTADWSSMGVSPSESLEILPFTIKYLCPYWISMICLGAIAAAVMSSADSSILSSSTLATWNVYKPLFKPSISNMDLAMTMKRIIWVVGIAATLIALQVKSIYALWYLCSDFVYCLLFPGLVCALFIQKCNTWGIVVGFSIAFIVRISGGEASLGIPAIINYSVDINDITYGLPFRTLAMLSFFITAWIVSISTQEKNPPVSLTAQTEKS